MPRRPRLPVRPEVEALRESVVPTRRDFHEHPELSWQEHRTQAIILERLTSLGLSDVRPVARTGPSPLPSARAGRACSA